MSASGPEQLQPGVAEGELVADVAELCRRLLGQGTAAHDIAVAALGGGHGDRLETLRLAVEGCRRQEQEPLPAGEQADQEPGLAEAVANELAAATAELADRLREALALRELLELSHLEIGQVMGIDLAAVPALLARSRLLLRARLRDTAPEDGAGCTDWERALRALACRQDGEQAGTPEQEWIREHMVACPGCERAHAAMLEASVCYRGWGRQRWRS